MMKRKMRSLHSREWKVVPILRRWSILRALTCFLVTSLKAVRRKILLFLIKIKSSKIFSSPYIRLYARPFITCTLLLFVIMKPFPVTVCLYACASAVFQYGSLLHTFIHQLVRKTSLNFSQCSNIVVNERVFISLLHI